MAVQGVLGQRMEQVDDMHLVFSKVKYQTDGDTLNVPHGAQSAAMLYGAGDGTAPTATITAGQNADSVALTGGTTGVTAWVVTRHSGNPGGIGGGAVT